MYRFIWSDFCDWYVEAVKIRLYASSDKNYNRALVNFAVSLFDGVLRLLHPIMPFATEQIWQAITPRAEGESICVAPVPEFDAAKASEQAVERFERVQSLTESIRALRGLMNVPPHENLPVVVSCPDAETQELYASEERVIQAMTKASTLELAVNAAKPDGAVSAVVQGAELFVVVKGVIDLAKERERLTKEISRLENLVKTTEAKLANEKFVANAAPELVAYEKQKLTGAQDSIQKIQANIAELA
jgi:valyl-tRNA synthetase